MCPHVREYRTDWRAERLVAHPADIVVDTDSQKTSKPVRRAAQIGAPLAADLSEPVGLKFWIVARSDGLKPDHHDGTAVLTRAARRPRFGVHSAIVGPARRVKGAQSEWALSGRSGCSTAHYVHARNDTAGPERRRSVGRAWLTTPAVASPSGDQSAAYNAFSKSPYNFHASSSVMKGSELV